mgnify:CR=1 FL=1
MNRAAGQSFDAVRGGGGAAGSPDPVQTADCQVVTRDAAGNKTTLREAMEKECANPPLGPHGCGQACLDFPCGTVQNAENFALNASTASGVVGGLPTNVKANDVAGWVAYLRAHVKYLGQAGAPVVRIEEEVRNRTRLTLVRKRPGG